MLIRRTRSAFRRRSVPRRLAAPRLPLLLLGPNVLLVLEEMEIRTSDLPRGADWTACFQFGMHLHHGGGPSSWTLNIGASVLVCVSEFDLESLILLVSWDIQKVY
ncbi:hypothetical protein BHE74_00012025 [Ensete ventricosum]|nr:hypothetical protein BHE74_00012025 [Ensete ventricosum]